MTSLSYFSIQERGERARVIEYLMSGSNHLEAYKKIARDQVLDESPSSEVSVDKNEVLKIVLIPARLSKFLRAALLIRHHYSHWCEFLKDTTQPPSIQLQSVIEDKVLLFLLFWCDAIKVFHLNPGYPFLICESVPEFTRVFGDYHICAEEETPEIIDSVLEVWKRMRMPGSNTKWGKALADVEERLRNGRGSGEFNDVNIGGIFFDLAKTYCLGFINDKSGQICHVEGIALNMDNFVKSCSAALAFDRADENSLDVVRELFPQFPDLVGNISKQYVFSSRTFVEPYFSVRKEILKELFDNKLLGLVYDERTPMYNHSILSMIRSHPQLYARWAVEPKLRVLYHELTDQVNNYE